MTKQPTGSDGEAMRDPDGTFVRSYFRYSARLRAAIRDEDIVEVETCQEELETIAYHLPPALQARCDQLLFSTALVAVWQAFNDPQRDPLLKLISECSPALDLPDGTEPPNAEGEEADYQGNTAPLWHRLRWHTPPCTSPQGAHAALLLAAKVERCGDDGLAESLRYAVHLFYERMARHQSLAA
jgi:hypothetical protein